MGDPNTSATSSKLRLAALNLTRRANGGWKVQLHGGKAAASVQLEQLAVERMTLPVSQTLFWYFFINCGKILTVSMVTWTSKHYHGYCEHLSMLTVSSRSLLVSSINTRPALAFPFSGLLIAWDRAAALSHGEHDFSKLIFHCCHAGASTRTRSVTHTGSWPLVWGSTSSAVTRLSWLLLRQLMYKRSAAQLTSSEAETLM